MELSVEDEELVEWEDGTDSLQQNGNFVVEIDSKPKKRISVEEFLADPDKDKVKRTPPPKLTKEEKLHLLNLHQIYFMVTMAYGKNMRKLCDDAFIQGCLYSKLSPALLTLVGKMKKQSHFLKLLNKLMEWWSSEFQTLKPEKEKDLITPARLFLALKKRRLDPVQNTLLFASLLRCLNMNVRIVVSFAISDVKLSTGAATSANQAKPKRATERPKKAKKKKRDVSSSSDEESEEDERSKIRVKAVRGKKARSSKSVKENEKSSKRKLSSSDGGELVDEALEVEHVGVEKGSRKSIKKAKLLIEDSGVSIVDDASEAKSIVTISSGETNRNNAIGSFGGPEVTILSDDEDECFQPLQLPNPITSPVSRPVSNFQGKCDLDIQQLWIELYSEFDHSWHCLNISSGIMDDGEQYRQGSNKRKAIKRPLYYFGFEGSRVVDVTPRYCSRWSEILNERKLSTSWIDDLLRFSSLRVVHPLPNCEMNPILIEESEGMNEEDEHHISIEGDLMEPKSNEWGYDNKSELTLFEAKINKEPLPDTLSAFQKHHLYCIEKFFNQGQIIYPFDTKPVGFFKSHPVYLRKDLKLLHTDERWIQEGKQVKKGEKVAKQLPKRLSHVSKKKLENEMALYAQQFANSDAMENNNPDEELRPMSNYYGEWQVEEFNPGSGENGKVPTNLYGNVYLFHPWMLPKKCSVIYFENAKQVGNKLGIHVAPAMVGWTNGRVSRPTLDGFVVCSENEKILIDACVEDLAVKKKRRQEEVEASALKNWAKLYAKIKNKYEPLLNPKPAFKEDEMPVEEVTEKHAHEFSMVVEVNGMTSKRCHCGFSITEEEI